MTRWVWRLVEWHLSRHLSVEALAPTLGDLTEDFEKRVRRHGQLRAVAWLIGETLSVAGAYRRRAHHDSPSARTVMPSLRMEETRLAVRRLAKKPAATAASVITLALGIGAAAATWSLVDQVLLHPLPVADPDRLVAVGWLRGSDSGARYSHTYPTVQRVRERGVFERVAAGGSPFSTELVGIGATVPLPRVVFYISHDFLDTLGVRVALGTGFRPDDDRRGAPIRVILSDRFWQRELQGDRAVVGRTITIAGRSATVAGVAPRAFRGIRLAESPDVYLPLHVAEDVSGPETNFFAEPAGGPRGSPTAWLTVVGRLRAHESAETATARLNTPTPTPGRPMTFALMDLSTAVVPEAARGGMRQFSRLLAITVASLLFIGCLTVGMLLLIRTEARRAELALCLALGATRGRLVRGIALEGLVLAIAAAALAVPVTWWLFEGMKSYRLPGDITIELLDLSLGMPVLIAASVAALAATLLIAMIAGVFGVRAHVADILRARTGATATVGRRRLRTALVSAQVAVALVLLAGAGLFARSLIAALSLNPGFDTTRVVSGSLSLARYGYNAPRATEFFTTLRDRLRMHPRIASSSLSRYEGGMTPAGQMIVDGVPKSFPSTVSFTAVDEHYFGTVGLRVLHGRNFAPADAAGAAPVVIVSESFGRLLAGGGDPIGHYLTESSGERAEIVGVVPDLITNVGVLEPLVKYYPMAQRRARPDTTLVVRAAASADDAIRETVAAIRQLDPTVTPPALLTVDDRIGRQMGPQRLGVAVLGSLGVIAVLLTIVGAYVLAETMASARRREIGIRAALGATRQQLGGLVLWETTRLVGVGLVVGLVCAWLLAGTIRAFLFRVEPFDALTLGVTAAAILVLALAVSLRPAVAAARVNLAGVLREE